jgi:hypothetical protein
LLSKKSKIVENKDKKHISEIALGEFAVAFAFVLFLMVFSSASAQMIPNLPVEGQAPYQTSSRPNEGVANNMNQLLSSGYSLSDNLSWNPIGNAQAVYNYVSWNTLGTYSEKINGQNYTFSKLDDGGSSRDEK